MLNTFLYIFAEKQSNSEYDTNSPTYLNTADGQRYWGVSLNLVENGTFSIPGSDQVSLQHGPIPALIFYAPIKLVGLNNAAVLIVAIQCAMLFTIGCLARSLATPYSANKNLLQGLIIFNPNLIGLAHHAQSDLIFAFIFSLVLYFISRCIERPDISRKFDYCMIGLFCGCLVLTRAAAMPYVLVLPFLLLLSIFLRRNTKDIDWVQILRRLALGVVITGLTIAPWYVRNYVVYDSLLLEREQTLKTCLDNYDVLLYVKYRKGFDERALLSREAISSYLESVSRPDCHTKPIDNSNYISNTTIDNSNYISNTISHNGPLSETMKSASRTSCTSLRTKACLSAILNEGFPTIAKAYLSGWGTLMISGSTSNIASYLGFHPPNYQRNIYYSVLSFTELSSHLHIMIKQNYSYFLFFFACTGFAVVSRLAGIPGLVTVIRSKSFLPYTLFYCLTIFCFLLTYMFVGISRYRAPLEPLLMLFAAVGITQCRTIVKQYSRKKKLRN